MEIQSATKKYFVKFENSLDFIKDLIELNNTLYVIGHNVYRLYRTYFKNIPEDKLFIFEATEENKTIQKALEICEKMTNIPAKRNARIVSFGGGITQDVTGFAANIIYRGIKWIFVPTTLLSACDSCIGGKTSLNYNSFKNLLGTFYPPDEIIICSEFFDTLSEKDFNSGLGEVVKFNIMRGPERIDIIEEDLNKVLQRDKKIIDEYVKNSLVYKKIFIEKDEFDKGERIKLNFAHTFGHAIEVVTDYEVPHGTAVVMGMIMANNVSLNRGLINKQFVDKCDAILKRIIDIGSVFDEIDFKQFINAMHKDKKQIDSNINAVLLTNDGLLRVNDLTEQEILTAIRHYRMI